MTLKLGLGLELTNRGRGFANPPVGFEPTADGVKIRLNAPRSNDDGAVSVTALTVDGVDRLADITASSPNLEPGTTYPRTVAGGGTLGSVTADTLVPGEWYYIQYEITALTGGNYPFFAAGSPFATSYNPLPTGVGKHSILVQVEPGFSGTGSVELIRNNTTSMTVAYVRIYKAEWDIDLTSSEELLETTNPLTLTGSASAVVLRLKAGHGLTSGEQCKFTYQLTQNSSSLFFIPNSPGPFPFTTLDPTVGVHQTVNLTADAGATAGDREFIRLTGSVSFAYASLRRVGDGRNISATITVGSKTYTGSTVAPLPNVWHVSGTGNDASGTGAPEAPFRTPARAMLFAGTAQTVYLRKGRFPGFAVTQSGTSTSARFKVTALPGEERLGRVVGLGTGDAVPTGNYYGVEVREQNYVEVSNLYVRDTKREGILFRGQEPEDDTGTPPTYTGHLIRGNITRNTGSSGIMVCGFYPGKRIGTGNAATEEFRISEVIIEYNDVSETNAPNDYNAGFQNADGNPGGNNECITVSSSALNVTTRYNYVHDSLQYGIDYKSGTRGGSIHHNHIWEMANHGIYIDASRRFVDDLDIYDNIIWGCRNGMVIDREADYDYDDPPPNLDDFQMRLHNIRVWNNVFFNMRRDGLVCYQHPGDYPSGEISDLSLRFNTIYNCGQEESFRREVRFDDWSEAAWTAVPVVTNFICAGNIAYRSTNGSTNVLDNFTGVSGFTVDDNLNFTGSVDPLFTAPDTTVVVGAGEYLPTLTLPDFTLQAGSPALSLASGYSASPYNTDFNGNARPDPADAGAYERP